MLATILGDLVRYPSNALKIGLPKRVVAKEGKKSSHSIFKNILIILEGD
jgi:hypothetical protein